MIKEVNPKEAWEILESDSRAVLLDVRSRMEYEYVGHPRGAVNIPWKEFPEWKVDLEFVSKVKAALKELRPETERLEEIPVLAICRSGSRSRHAGEALQEQGFAEVYNVAEGFEGVRDENGHRGTINGWRAHQLPWEQS